MFVALAATAALTFSGCTNSTPDSEGSQAPSPAASVSVDETAAALLQPMCATPES